MSVIGTGIAASVAQTAQNAQQVGRAQIKQKAETARLAQSEADRFDERTHATGQTEDSDQELPDRQAPGYEQLYLQQDHVPDHVPSQPQLPMKAEDDVGPAAPDNQAPLYRHLDIQG